MLLKRFRDLRVLIMIHCGKTQHIRIKINCTIILRNVYAVLIEVLLICLRLWKIQLPVVAGPVAREFLQHLFIIGDIIRATIGTMRPGSQYVRQGSPQLDDIRR